MTDEPAALLREVIARPDDDGVRAVLADVLQAAGDPRGELISLQLLASRGNRDRDDRIQELLNLHAHTWLGDLRDAASACQFDRGFLRRLELGSAWASNDPRWDTCALDPALATVEDLLSGGERGVVYRKFVTSPTMRNLKRIHVYDRDSLEGLEQCTSPIEHVACGHFTTDYDYALFDHGHRARERRAARRVAHGLDPYVFDDDEVEDYFHDEPHEVEEEPVGSDDDDEGSYYQRLWEIVAARPAVTSLGIHQDQLDMLVREKWFAQIRALQIGGTDVRKTLERWHELGRRRLTLVPRSQLEPCERRFPWDYKVEVIPAHALRATVRISGEWLIMPTTVLEALPDDVTRIEIEYTSDVIAQRIRSVVARPGVEVVEVPLRANNFVWEIRDGGGSS